MTTDTCVPISELAKCVTMASDAATAASLRTSDGHMKTSAGNNLPIDPNSGMFLAGDVRADENPDLTSLQILFVREHNFQIDRLHELHPNWSGEQLYQMRARS